MDKTKTVKTRKTPTPAFAVISFLVIVAVLVALINLGVDTTMSVFIAALIAVVIALLLDIPWADVERTLLRVVSDCIPTFLIVIMVGMLVGIWMAGGTVPALMYYGMKLISPKILVPLAFVLSGLTAEFTGTSFATPFVTGSAALMMEWGILRGNDPFLYGEKIKAYLIHGAKQLPGFTEWPNPQLGWGVLCLADSLPK